MGRPKDVIPTLDAIEGYSARCTVHDVGPAELGDSHEGWLDREERHTARHPQRVLRPGP